MFAIWVPVIIGFLVSAVAIAAMRPVAFRLALVDKPGGRKIHNAEVPLVGGLGMFLGLFVALGFLPMDLRPTGEFAAVCAIFVLIGLLDDRYGLSPLFRLAIQLGAAVWIATETGLSAQFLGTLLAPDSVVLLDWSAICLTSVLVAGGVNAFNMIDGIDGLAGSMGLVAMLSIAALSFDSGLAAPMGVALIASGAVAAFLAFNLPLGFNRALRCFMGDAGSMLIGFIVAWLMLSFSQDAASRVEPAGMLFFVALPIADLLWVFGVRLRRGQSPFRADNSHLHHYLLKAQISHAGALGVLTVAAVVMSVLGIVMIQFAGVSGITLLGIFLGCCGIVVTCVVSAERWAGYLPSAVLVVEAREVEI
jgi:UDP-GlcNAc:undecaprenyl-phosphate GlcNAc-1-phosphate transferase